MSPADLPRLRVAPHGVTRRSRQSAQARRQRPSRNGVVVGFIFVVVVGFGWACMRRDSDALEACSNSSKRFPGYENPPALVAASLMEIGITPYSPSAPLLRYAHIATRHSSRIVANWMAVTLKAPLLRDPPPTLSYMIADGSVMDVRFSHHDWELLHSAPANTCEGAFMRRPDNKHLVESMVQSVSLAPIRCSDAYLRFPELENPRGAVQDAMRVAGLNPFRADPFTQRRIELADRTLLAWMLSEVISEDLGLPRVAWPDFVVTGGVYSFRVEPHRWESTSSWTAATCGGAFLENPDNRELVRQMRAFVR